MPYTLGMRKRSSKPDDANKLAAAIVSEATGIGKNPAAVALGRLGGLKGGPARAARLSAAKRKRIATRAAEARWKAAKSR